MQKNFGQLRATLDSWARESVDTDVGRDALNDAISKVWRGIIKAQVEQMVQGPISLPSGGLAAASERAQLISILDPTVAPVVVDGGAFGALAQHTPFLAYTICTESGSETLMSPVTSNVVIPAGHVAQVNSPARPAPGAIGASSSFGWNVYGGSTLANMCRQNDAPLVFGQSWIEPLDIGIIDQGDQNQPGPLPPSENSTADDIFYIRAMETPLSTGGFKRWNNVAIDSLLWQWATRSIASTSEYQPYYWDLINGRQLEYRPALGASANPRFFFIHRPRRISYDSAPIPFLSIDCEACLRSYALADWKLTQDEFISSNTWRQRGDAELLDILETFRQQDWNKDIAIVPYMAGG